ncbi:MAG: hypothetical protein JSV21_00770 [Nitrospirota bacterium]|nr:MAG: hypothetical protein JSV21_00770 [Nitrospirota bacterium]
MNHNEHDRKGDPETIKWWTELEDRPLGKLRPCCKLIVESGLEALQWTDCEGTVHNMLVNYCPQCGTKLTKYMKGAETSDCDECEDCN